MAKKKNAGPKQGASVSAQRRRGPFAFIKSNRPPDSECPVWQLHLMELGEHAPWSFLAMSEKERSFLFDKMRTIDKSRWREFEGRQRASHLLNYDSLSKEARNRLEELQLDDYQDEVYSIRLSNLRRLIGIRKSNVFKLLWWDPAHTVCPSKKK